MREKRAFIDSLNLSTFSLDFRTSKSDYSVNYLEKNVKEDQEEFRKCFGTTIPGNVAGAAIVYPLTGGAIPVKTYVRKGHLSHVIEFAGLHSYTPKSDEVIDAFHLLRDDLQDAIINRLDVAIDYKRLPGKVKDHLIKTRQPFIYKNSQYMKTAKEGKKNNYISVVIYDKAKKEELHEERTRLEISFRGQYFKGETLKDLQALTSRMKKSIKKLTGIDVKIDYEKLLIKNNKIYATEAQKRGNFERSMLKRYDDIPKAEKTLKIAFNAKEGKTTAEIIRDKPP